MWKAVVVVALTSLVGVGCRSILGVDGYGTLAPDGGTSSDGAAPTFIGKCDGTAYDSASCRDCIDDRCCAEATKCLVEPACAALSSCLAKCAADDAACKVKCNLGTRRTTEMSNLMVCAAKNCVACAEAHATFGGVACEQCLEQHDPAELDTLAQNVDALELEACEADCPPGYESYCACDDHFAAGNPLLNKLRRVPLCLSACAETDWSCLGAVNWPPLADVSPPLELHVGVADVEFSNTVSNASIHACAGIDVACDRPQQMAVWDADGQFADLTLSRAGTGEGGTNYFGGLLVEWTETGQTELSSVILGFFPPIRRTPAWTWRRLVSRDEAESFVRNAGIADHLDWNAYGGIVWSVAACNDVTAAGLTASLDTGEPAYYLAPSQTLMKGLTATTKSGLGAFISLSPGPRTLELRRQSDGRKIGTYPLNVRQGTITTVSLSPAPDSEP
ncbi:MAG TPA: hypothetical protein VH062_23945 [Polyangiaceae bacterium]|jgi:hypothetical protein|nr:hypothetical protein [Polyangiaceae bacterium]